jgi:hypothetical protein
MNAIGIIYPQYWEAFDVKSMFANHLAILKALLCHPKPIGPNGTLVVNLLDQILFNQQISFFVIRMKKIAMVHNICCQVVTLQQNCGDVCFQVPL